MNSILHIAIILLTTNSLLAGEPKDNKPSIILQAFIDLEALAWQDNSFVFALSSLNHIEDQSSIEFLKLTRTSWLKQGEKDSGWFKSFLNRLDYNQFDYSEESLFGFNPDFGVSTFHCVAAVSCLFGKKICVRLQLHGHFYFANHSPDGNSYPVPRTRTKKSWLITGLVLHF